MARDQAEPAAAPAKKGKGLLVVIVLAVALSLGAGGAAVAVLMKSKGGEAPAAAGEHGAPAEAGASGGGGGHGQEGGAEQARGVLTLESFVSNLADPEGDRYVKVTLRLVLDSREAAEVAKTDDLSITRIRDRILTLLSSKTFAQVSTAEGKAVLRQEISDGVSAVLARGKVAEVYYTEFIVQ